MAITRLDPYAVVQSSVSSAQAPVPLGPSWQPEDLRVVYLTSSSSRTFDAPAGWTVLHDSGPSGAAVSRRLTIIARRLQAGDIDTTATVVGDPNPNIAVTAVTLRGTAPAASPSVSVTGSNNSATNISAPSVPGGAGALLCWYGNTRVDGTAQTGSWTTPSGMALVASSLSDATNGYSLLLAAENRTTVGDTGPRGATAPGAGSWSAASLFIAEPTGPTTITAPDSATRTETATTSSAVEAADAPDGADAATTAAGFTTGDVASSTEGVAAGQLTEGPDTGQAVETAASTGELTATDLRQGTDTAGTLGSFTDTDTGSHTETTGIGIPAPDIGTRTEDVTTRGSFATTDARTGADAATVETLYGDLVISIWAVDPATGALTALPDFTKLTMSPERNGPGNITLEYPRDGLNFSVLRNAITTDRDLEVEIWNFGNSTGALRGYLQESSGDDIAEDQSTWTFAGGFLELRMGEAIVWPQPIVGEITLGENVDVPLGSVTEAQWDRLLSLGYTGTAGDSEEKLTGVPQKVLDAVKANATSIPVLADPKRELKFAAVTAGELVNFLLTQARSRGTLTDIATSFTDAADSKGITWPTSVTAKYSPGASYDSILNSLASQGRVEWSVTWDGTHRVLNLHVPSGRGVDRTVGLRPVVLRAGRNLAEAPRKWSVRSSVTAMLGIGSEGFYADASNLDAQTRRGRRIENSTSSQNLATSDAVQAYAQRRLSTAKDGTLEVTHGLAMLPGEPRPLVAFDVGDWVYSQTANSLDRYRVVQWTLTADAGQQASATVTLNDAFLDAVSRQQKELDALTSGETVAGTSTETNRPDTGVPSAPGGLVVGSAAFSDGPDSYAVVSAGWAPVTTNTDGTAATDIDGYRVEWTRYSNPEAWTYAGNTPTTQFQFTTVTGLPILVRVACYDRSGNQSEWTELVAPHTTESDVTPPGVPSTMTGENYLGLVAWTWDGLTEDGADMYLAHPDFAHAQLHMSTTSDFTPDVSTQMGKVFGAGTYTYATTADGEPLTYGTSYFAKLVAVDLRDNISEPSEQASAVPGQLVNIDLGPDAVDRANIRNAAIGEAQIEELAVNDAHIMNMNVGKLTAGIMEASMIMGTGAIISGDPDGYHVRTDSSGIRLFGADGTTVTTRFLSSDGSALVSGEYRSAQSGERFVINPGGANPDEIRFYPSSTNQYGNMQVVTSTSTIFGPQPGVQLTAHSGRQDGATGILQVFPDYASLAWGPMYVQTVPHQIGLRAPRFHIGMPRGSGFALSPAEDEIMRIGVSNNSTGLFIDKTVIEYSLDGSDQPNWKCRTLDIGLSFRSGYLAVINGPGSAWREIRASAFVPTSSLRATKQDFAGITYDGGALGALRRAPVQMWRRIAEVSEYGDQAATHIGPMADDLPDEVVRRADDGVTGYALDSLVGLVQAAVVQLADQQDDIADRLERMEAAR